MDAISELKNKINLVDLAEHHGYEHNKRKSTKKALFMERGGDQILIYQHGPGNDSFYYSTCNNPGDKGDVVNFVINKGMAQNTKEAIAYLRNLDPHSYISAPVKPKIVSERAAFVPVKCFFPADAQNYLVVARGIPLDVLRSRLFHNSVGSGESEYGPSKMKSAFFPLSYRGQVVGQNIRNENFEHLVENSNKTDGYWSCSLVDVLAPIAVFENPIDAISHHVLTGAKHWYSATVGSPSKKVIDNILSVARHEKRELILCGDHDKAGQNFNLNFLCSYISQVHNIDLSASFRAPTNEYFLTLRGAVGRVHREAFDGLARDGRPHVVAVSHQVDKVIVQTPYSVPALIGLAQQLLDKFDVSKSFRIERSKAKDFNQDLQDQQKVPKKKLAVGLSF